MESHTPFCCLLPGVEDEGSLQMCKPKGLCASRSFHITMSLVQAGGGPEGSEGQLCCHECNALCSVTGSASLRGGCGVAFPCTGSSQAGFAQDSGISCKEVVTSINMYLQGDPAS